MTESFNPQSREAALQEASQKTKKQNPAPEIQAKLSQEPDQALKDVMGLIDNLKDTYIEETKALNAGDTKTFMALQDQKHEKVKLYQSGIRQILVRQEEIKKVAPDLKEQLEGMYTEFTDLVQRNQTALGNMKKASQRMADIMMKAVKKEIEKQQTKSYKADGKMTEDKERSISSGSVSETA